jgi:DNA-binding LacI/PurR family transcriptional regulator
MVSGYFDIEGGRESTEMLLEQSPEITAVFAASDEMAMGALIAARAAGRRVPQDLSVIGVDGHDACEVLGLTTISQAPVTQGGDAARYLLDMIAGGEPPAAAATLYPTELVVRTSTAPPPG